MALYFCLVIKTVWWINNQSEARKSIMLTIGRCDCWIEDKANTDTRYWSLKSKKTTKIPQRNRTVWGIQEFHEKYKSEGEWLIMSAIKVVS